MLSLAEIQFPAERGQASSDALESVHNACLVEKHLEIPVSGALYTVIEFSFAISIANLRVEILLACS